MAIQSFSDKATRKPTTPGEILQEEFLLELGISQKRLASHIGCDIKVINRIVNNRTSVTAEMALKLASALNTSPQFWLNAQQAVDIYNALKTVKSFPRLNNKSKLEDRTQLLSFHK